MGFDPKEIQTTLGAGVDRLSCLIYGAAGAGKTSLAATTGALDKTLVLSAEAGLLPLRHYNIKHVEITGARKLFDVLEWLERSGKAGKLEGRWIILDSISEIAERLLRELKTTPLANGKMPDPRQAYGEVQDQILEAMKRFRDLPCHTVFIAKMERVEDGDRRLVYGPALPGKKLAGASVYEFDLVLAMRLDRGTDGVRRWLQTEADGRYEAKDRSGALSPEEPADLGTIARKILGERTAEAQSEAATPDTTATDAA